MLKILAFWSVVLSLWMALQTASLNSGSNGNCYYVGNDTEAVLIDAGISCLETEKRMKRLGLPIEKVKAIFISHEHYDHVRGLEVLSRKYQLPVYCSPLTFQFGNLNVHQHIAFQGDNEISVGKLTIKTFSKIHDAADPHSFVVSCGEVNIGVFTDLGYPCNNTINHFKNCHAVFIEANYDDGMLLRGRYPYHLKNRIRSGKGHLSNAQALQVFLTHRPSFMSHLFLAHLSKDNNNPELVWQLFNEHALGTQIVIASRDKETGVFDIGTRPKQIRKSRFYPIKEASQLSLF